MINDYLKATHTDEQQSIMIDNSDDTLDLSVEIIKQDAETDFDCMVEQLRESDEITNFITSIVGRSRPDAVIGHLALDALAEKNLIELIELKLRSI